uniref:Uncharacterized protein n=1 Tax=Chromera velia CCMP2878 TaxID=1169474 RepID=A0A0G4GLU5_9ALVE|eukprot:Cvel_4895.t1-p1 / transcript=Cvel_4895.t1 / gene=Cvel_4895 / organism=Chromera_velia_CCMP2878 / gene_product=Zinc finger protein 331, putative / transcript_product=Zinc finger protein 331, putative / location=Cvel_scaffold220:106114-108727(-) / protein_length=188 / sequence_SO=supercontig / SO=protein_coding / is_pseudo=false
MPVRHVILGEKVGLTGAGSSNVCEGFHSNSVPGVADHCVGLQVAGGGIKPLVRGGLYAHITDERTNAKIAVGRVYASTDVTALIAKNVEEGESVNTVGGEHSAKSVGGAPSACTAELSTLVSTAGVVLCVITAVNAANVGSAGEGGFVNTVANARSAGSVGEAVFVSTAVYVQLTESVEVEVSANMDE